MTQNPMSVLTERNVKKEDKERVSERKKETEREQKEKNHQNKQNLELFVYLIYIWFSGELIQCYSKKNTHTNHIQVNKPKDNIQKLSGVLKPLPSHSLSFLFARSSPDLCFFLNISHVFLLMQKIPIRSRQQQQKLFIFHIDTFHISAILHSSQVL